MCVWCDCVCVCVMWLCVHTAREYYQLLVELVRWHGVLRAHTSLLPESVRLLQTESQESTRQLPTGVRRRRVSSRLPATLLMPPSVGWRSHNDWLVSVRLLWWNRVFFFRISHCSLPIPDLSYAVVITIQFDTTTVRLLIKVQ